MKTKSIGTFMEKPLENLTKKELLECIKYLLEERKRLRTDNCCPIKYEAKN